MLVIQRAIGEADDKSSVSLTLPDGRRVVIRVGKAPVSGAVRLAFDAPRDVIVERPDMKKAPAGAVND